MNRPRIVRALRIAWSVAWGIVAVLLIVLWVRSYWWWDSAKWNFTKDMSVTVCTEDGVTAITYLDVPSPWPANAVIERWEYQSYPSRSLESKSPMRFTRDKLFVNRSPSGLIVAFPPCAVAIGFAAIAVAPWIHLSNRFSLRTLLIATTLVAVGLGLIVWLR